MMRRASECAVVLGCVLALFGCGGSGGGGGTGPTTPTTQRNVIVEETFSDLPSLEQSEFVFYLGFFTGTAGSLDITVDWTLASNDVDILLFRGTVEQALSTACVVDGSECPLELVTSAATLGKPEVMRVASAAAGDYVIVVANFGPTNESGVVVVGLTTATTAIPADAVGAVRSGTVAVVSSTSLAKGR